MSVKITHDRNICIGCGACTAVCPDFWEMSDDSKSNLKGAKGNGSSFMLELPDKKCNMNAAQSCPVNCIHIEEKGKKLI